MLSISLLLAHSVYADTAIITHSNVVEAVPTIETSAYASGDVIGEKLSLSDAARSLVSTGIISSVVIVDKDSEAVDIDVVFFDANPAAFGNDNAAFDPTDADVANIVCVVSVTDYYTFNDNSVGIAQNVNCPFDLGSTNTTLYAALVSRGTPTYTAATDLTLRVGILQD
jgi:hypothetical protein